MTRRLLRALLVVFGLGLAAAFSDWPETEARVPGSSDPRDPHDERMATIVAAVAADVVVGKATTDWTRQRHVLPLPSTTQVL